MKTISKQAAFARIESGPALKFPGKPKDALPGKLDCFTDAELGVLAPGWYNDQPGKGLALDVQVSGSRSWVFKTKFDGKPEYMSFGTLDLTTRWQARAKHLDALRKRHVEKVSPKQERDGKAAARTKAATLNTLSFRTAATAWLAAKHESGKWKDTSRYSNNISQSFENHVYPIIGDDPILSLIDGEKIIGKVLKPHWHASPTMGETLRQRIYNVFRHAFANHRDIKIAAAGDNPVELDLVNAALSERKAREVTHHASMPYRDVPAFMGRLREREAVGAKALEIAILSALRVNSIAPAQWVEIDFRKAAWTIPGERMKSGKDYVVPLTDRMLEIFRDLRERAQGEAVFPGHGIDKPIANQTMLNFLQEGMGETDATVHGFRSSFRNWAFEQGRDNDGLRFIKEIPELTLDHKIGDDTELSYLTSDGRDLKREVLTAWENFCGGKSPVADSKVAANVVRLKTRRAA